MNRDMDLQMAMEAEHDDIHTAEFDVGDVGTDAEGDDGPERVTNGHTTEES
jgi:hypothetical protein